MKKIALVLVAAGLMSLAACNKNPEAAAIENNADMVADNIDSAADNAHDTADNVRADGDAKADNVSK
ncbi:hypothetical protein BH10PSE15_BH10PSE15_00990 [soil metagenome]